MGGGEGPQRARPGAAALRRTLGQSPGVPPRPRGPLPGPWGGRRGGPKNKLRRGGRDGSPTPPGAARRGRQGARSAAGAAAQGHPYWGPFPLRRVVSSRLCSHSLPWALFSWRWLFPFPPPSRTQSLTLASVANFLKGPHYIRYLPFLSPFPLHPSPFTFFSFLPLFPFLPSFLSLFLFDYSHFSFPIPVRLILFFFLISCLYLSLLSVFLSPSSSFPLSPSPLLLISLIGSPAPAPLMSPIHSRA